MTKLKVALARLPARTWHERQETHSDILEGFLKRLAEIPTDRPNIANRLVDSARCHARRQQRNRQKLIPADLTWLPSRLPTPGGGPRNWSQALADIAADITANGRSLDPIDLELIARTRIDGDHLNIVAADLGLPIEAAYKRRQRAEARIATLYRTTTRRAHSQQLMARRGAMEALA